MTNLDKLPKAELLPDTHDLKIWPEYFREVANGTKTAEYRLNDRNYKVGDKLILREFDPRPGHVCGDYTGRAVERLITHVLPLNNDYAVLSHRHPAESAASDGLRSALQEVIQRAGDAILERAAERREQAYGYEKDDIEEAVRRHRAADAYTNAARIVFAIGQTEWEKLAAPSLAAQGED